MYHSIDTITSLVRWFCQKLSLHELITAAAIILQVINDERDDIRPRDDFKEKHPSYRKFTVDPDPPLLQPSKVTGPHPSLDYRQLLQQHLQKTGKTLAPVRRRANSHRPPAGSRCERCHAPQRYLYVNDGTLANQLRCKVCQHLFPSHRSRKQSQAKYWCPHCGWALYRWKQEPSVTIYKCPNDLCPTYSRHLQKLNPAERALQLTGMSSQFKLRYQYREYHFSPADLQPLRPQADSLDLNHIRKHFSTLGLVLSYSISFGLSSRMTAQILRRMHSVSISHQTVQNYVQAAAVLASRFNDRYLGPLSDPQLAGDETYIKVHADWQYTFFIIGANSRAIRAWNISEHRDTLAATATLYSALDHLAPETVLPFQFIADGNPAYDAAVLAINADSLGQPKPLERRTVIGLKNLDPESEQFRPFKQLIERLNRTYKFHTRARAGFKNQPGALALTALFVAYYNFLRPHGSLNYQVPIPIPDLLRPATLQGQWLKLLELAV